jgi:hypothetical protein
MAPLLSPNFHGTPQHMQVMIAAAHTQLCPGASPVADFVICLMLASRDLRASGGHHRRTCCTTGFVFRLRCWLWIRWAACNSPLL